MGTRKLTNACREDLGDARIKLDTAAHNLQVMIKNPQDEDVRAALDNAVTMATQALAALRRVQGHLGGD
jgi:hypothetical protein